MSPGPSELVAMPSSRCPVGLRSFLVLARRVMQNQPDTFRSRSQSDPSVRDNRSGCRPYATSSRPTCSHSTSADTGFWRNMSAPALMDSAPSCRLASVVITMMGTVVVRMWVLKRRVSSSPVIEPAQCPSVMTTSVGCVIATSYAMTVVAAVTTRYPDARNARVYASLSSTELLTNRIDGVRRARVAIHFVPFPVGSPYARSLALPVLLTIPRRLRSARAGPFRDAVPRWLPPPRRSVGCGADPTTTARG
jgi:hypothetical protein